MTAHDRLALIRRAHTDEAADFAAGHHDIAHGWLDASSQSPDDPADEEAVYWHAYLDAVAKRDASR